MASAAATALFDDLNDSDGENENGVTAEDGFDLSADADGLEEADEVDMDRDEEAEHAALGQLADVQKEIGMLDDKETKARVEKMDFAKVQDVRTVAGLMEKLSQVLKQIEDFNKQPTQNPTTGSIEDNAEYQLLTKCNVMSTQIDGEIMVVHKFIRDHYSARFPELDRLVENAIEYANVVKALGNDIITGTGITPEAKERLGLEVSKAVNMTIVLEATTTQGAELSESELARVVDACDMLLKLDYAKGELTSYVESRIAIFAPNLSILIGPHIAAQLVAFTGGITGLAKRDSRSLASLGNTTNRQVLGLAANAGIRNQGFLYQTAIVEATPTDLKVQIMRALSAKVSLAARVDAVHQATDGSQGLEMFEAIEKRIEHLTRVPENLKTKALAAPDEKKARKRGGRRARKAKESEKETDMSKMQNRMAFGKEEAEVGFGTGDSTVGLGMLGSQDDGRVRALQVDQRTRAKLSKKTPGWGGGTATGVGGTATMIGQARQGTAASLRGAGLRAHGVGTGASGTASNIAFTPVQGLELVDPKAREEQNRKRKAEEDRWFSGGTFTQVGGAPAAPSPNGPSKLDSAGFKIPALPNKKAKTDG